MGKTSKVKPTKGFLYQIKTNENNSIIGHLFGTCHTLNFNKTLRLHPWVLSCFDRSSHLFLEMQSCLSEDNTILQGVDHFLERRANIQGKKISDLEPYRNVVEKDELLTIFLKVVTKYNWIVTLINNKHIVISTIIKELTELMPLILCLKENQKFLGEDLTLELFKITKSIIQESYILGLIPDDLNNLFLISVENNPEFFFDKSENKSQQKYVEGDESIWESTSTGEIRALQDKSENKYQQKYVEGDESIWESASACEIRSLQYRDLIMAEIIDTDLKRTCLSKENRCGFYALGAHHVLGKYPDSLPELLKQKGWILNKIELPSILLLEKQSSFDNLNLACSQNRFFSIDKALLKTIKPERRILEDNTRTDPYGSQAIVPYRP